MYSIDDLTEVVAEITVTDTLPCCWFVIAAWAEEDKQWCGVEFGFGDHDAALFRIDAYGPCFPDDGLEISTDHWPGPSEGTAFVVTGPEWSGNWLPVYYFQGLAYGYGATTVIPLNEDPATGFIGFSNCLCPSTQWEVEPEGRGAMGIATPGIVPQFPVWEMGACCYETGDCILLPEPECYSQGGWYAGGDCQPNPCPQPQGACCVGGYCHVTDPEECQGIGGEWLGTMTACDPNPCEAVCCLPPTFEECIITLEDDCAWQGGHWHPDWVSCERNVCELISPARPATWGRIKSMYR